MRDALRFGSAQFNARVPMSADHLRRSFSFSLSSFLQTVFPKCVFSLSADLHGVFIIPKRVVCVVEQLEFKDLNRTLMVQRL